MAALLSSETFFNHLLDLKIPGLVMGKVSMVETNRNKFANKLIHKELGIEIACQ